MGNKCDTQLPPSLGCVVQLILPIQPAYISLGVRVHTGIHVPLITVQLWNCTFYPNIWIACFIILSEEWVIVFLTQMSNFSAILRREQVTFDEEIMRPTLLVSFLNVVLAHWNNNPWVDMLLHFDKVSQFRVNQSLLFLLNDACNKYHLTVFGLTRPGHSRRAR